MNWDDLKQGLLSDDPAGYVKNLHDSGELKNELPEIDALFGVPQAAEHHPEIDTGIHTLMVVKRAAELSDDVTVRFAALTHDLGKGLTPKEEWPRHINHEVAGVQPIIDLSERLNVPQDISDFAQKVSLHHLKGHRSLEMRPGKIVSLFEDLGAFEDPEVLEKFVKTVQADAQGRLGMENSPYPQADYLRSAFQVAKAVGNEDDTEILMQRRNQAIADVKQELNLS